MLTPISKFIRAKIATLPYIGTAYGLSKKIKVGGDDGETEPAVNMSGEWVALNLDTHPSLTYIVQDGEISRETVEHEYIAGKYLITETYPLKIVLYVQGKEDIDCASYSQNVAFEISKLFTGEQKLLRQALNVENADFTVGSINYNKAEVWADEFTAPNKLAEKDILVAIELEVEISGIDSCFVNNPCDVPDFDFDFSTACCYTSKGQSKNIAEGSNSVYHGLSGVPDFIQYWSGSNLLQAYQTFATNQQLVISSTDPLDGVTVNAVRFNSICATQLRKKITIVGGVPLVVAHGLSVTPDMVAYWQDGYYIAQPFQTVANGTTVTINSTDDYIGVTMVLLTFGDCGKNDTKLVQFNTAFSHSLVELPKVVQYWSKDGENYTLLGGQFETVATDTEITVNSPDEYDNVYIKMIA